VEGLSLMPPTGPDFDPNEAIQSQLPAISLLSKLNDAGAKFHYLTQDEALALRGGKASQVLLTEILQAQLSRINTIHFKGREHKFSAANIKRGIAALEDVPLVEGLMRANELTYDLLRLGKSFDQTIDGDTKSFTMRYVDWDSPASNVFHVTTEYDLVRAGSDKHCYLDLVLFVNGVPFVNIECKAPGIGLEHAISDVLAYQGQGYVPEFYKYIQLVLAVNKNEAKYATVGTEAKFWAVWKSRENIDAVLQPLITESLETTQKERVGHDFVREQRAFYDVESSGRTVCEQDRALYELCRPSRLLELTQKFVLFDGGVKKVARYQQFYAVKNAMARLEHGSGSGPRAGGVIWHTQGSGKSLTMVMLASAIAMSSDIENPRIVLVTDRVDLDKQLSATFKRCGLDTHRATSGADLRRQIDGTRSNVVTALVHKFRAAAAAGEFENDSRDIFVLVDESHRTQYGDLAVQMRRIFPNACYLGFTGTPLMHKEKSTLAKFGGLIDTYTLREAVDDKAVVPLLYERRHVEQIVQQGAIDTWFERICQGLTTDQKRDLKKKFSRAEPLTRAQQRLKAIAYDVYEHYRANWLGTGYKAQLVAPDKKTAVFLKQCLDEIGGSHDEDDRVSSEVVISPPDEREGYEEVDGEAPDATVEQFWRTKMSQFGSSEDRYIDETISRFNSADAPEILVVVSKLITGFDVPRNTVLYLARRLENHTLLQAIARVNRLYEGKDFGFILDYVGILGELDRALSEYAALASFDEVDLAGSLNNIRNEVDSIPEKYAALLDLFREVKNPHDQEEFERLLAKDELRKEFRDRVNAFARSLHLALSTEYFYELESPATIDRYKSDLKRFMKLRRTVELRYGDVVDMKKLEPQIEKLLDTYVTSDSIEPLTVEPIDIMDTAAMEKALNSLGTPAARADAIASATKRTITERMDEDPILYLKFSELIEETIRSFRDHVISELEYLKQMRELRNQVADGVSAGVPPRLVNNDVAQAYFRVISEQWHALGDGLPGSEEPIDLALKLDSVIRSRASVVDWRIKQDVQKGIRADIDDVFYAEAEGGHLNLDWAVIDELVGELLRIAKSRLP
jgi:type I restriction enzyme R subunit